MYHDIESVGLARAFVNIHGTVCFMSSDLNPKPTRKYRQRTRAEQQDATRQRIVEAAVELHESVGGEGATITAVADRAGVGRVTVYRHFADERQLYAACTQHYLTNHPLPDPGVWLTIEPRRERLKTALSTIYAYHRMTEKMMVRQAADTVSRPVLAELLAPLRAYWNHARDSLAASATAPAAPTRKQTALVGHFLAFGTWQSLALTEGLTDEEAVNLAVDLIEASLRCAGT